MPTHAKAQNKIHQNNVYTYIYYVCMYVCMYLTSWAFETNETNANQGNAYDTMLWSCHGHVYVHVYV